MQRNIYVINNDVIFHFLYVSQYLIHDNMTQVVIET